jgi:hypothetical protein
MGNAHIGVRIHSFIHLFLNRNYCMGTNGSFCTVFNRSTETAQNIRTATAPHQLSPAIDQSWKTMLYFGVIISGESTQFKSILCHPIYHPLLVFVGFFYVTLLSTPVKALRHS